MIVSLCAQFRNNLSNFSVYLFRHIHFKHTFSFTFSEAAAYFIPHNFFCAIQLTVYVQSYFLTPLAMGCFSYTIDRLV